MSALKVGICPALNEEVLCKLHDSNIHNSIDFLLLDIEVIATRTNINYKSLQIIRQILVAHHSAISFIGMNLFNEVVHSVSVISTGLESLDNLLDGGLMTGEVVEICGQSAVGMSRLCCCLAVATALRQRKTVLYIDPATAVTPINFLSAMELTKIQDGEEDKLNNIQLMTPSNIWELFQILRDIRGLNFNQPRVKLLIIDALPLLLIPELSSQKQGNGIINQLSVLLKAMAHDLHIAVVIINYLVTDYKATESRGTTYKPSLGRLWAHVPHMRLEVQKSLSPLASETAGFIAVTVKKSTRLPMRTTNVCLL